MPPGYRQVGVGGLWEGVKEAASDPMEFLRRMSTPGSILHAEQRFKMMDDPEFKRRMRELYPSSRPQPIQLLGGRPLTPVEETHRKISDYIPPALHPSNWFYARPQTEYERRPQATRHRYDNLPFKSVRDKWGRPNIVPGEAPGTPGFLPGEGDSQREWDKARERGEQRAPTLMEHYFFNSPEFQWLYKNIPGGIEKLTKDPGALVPDSMKPAFRKIAEWGGGRVPSYPDMGAAVSPGAKRERAAVLAQEETEDYKKHLEKHGGEVERGGKYDQPKMYRGKVIYPPKPGDRDYNRKWREYMRAAPLEESHPLHRPSPDYYPPSRTQQIAAGNIEPNFADRFMGSLHELLGKRERLDPGLGMGTGYRRGWWEGPEESPEDIKARMDKEFHAVGGQEGYRRAKRYKAKERAAGEAGFDSVTEHEAAIKAKRADREFKEMEYYKRTATERRKEKQRSRAEFDKEQAEHEAWMEENRKSQKEHDARMDKSRKRLASRRAARREDDKRHNKKMREAREKRAREKEEDERWAAEQNAKIKRSEKYPRIPSPPETMAESLQQRDKERAMWRMIQKLTPWMSPGPAPTSVEYPSHGKYPGDPVDTYGRRSGDYDIVDVGPSRTARTRVIPRPATVNVIPKPPAGGLPLRFRRRPPR